VTRNGDDLPEGEGRDEHGAFIANEKMLRVLAPYMNPKGSYTSQLEAKRQETKRPMGDACAINDDLSGRVKLQARARDIDKTAEGCAFLRDTLAAGGANLTSEPQWHDMATVACWCADPEGTIHRLVSGSQWYNFEDTAMKLADAQEGEGEQPQARLHQVRDPGGERRAAVRGLQISAV
jgi:hypothetical protein